MNLSMIELTAFYALNIHNSIFILIQIRTTIIKCLELVLRVKVKNPIIGSIYYALLY